MRKLILLAIVMIFALLIFGCYTPNAPPKEGKDCGADQTCFEELAKNCEKGYVEIEQEGNKAFGQIVGKEGENCIVYVQAKESPELPPQLNGLDMTCKVPVEKLSGMNIDVEDADCEGPLFEGLKMFQQEQSEEFP